MLPKSSRLARAPGGTRQVASYSSTMQGPSRGAGEVGAAQHRRLQPAGRRAEIGAARRQRCVVGRAPAAPASGLRPQRVLGRCPGRSGGSRSARPAPRGRRGGRRCARARAERFLERGERGRVERPVGDRHGQLEGLALVVQAGAAPDAHRARRRSPRRRAGAAPRARAPARPRPARRGRALRSSAPEGARVVVLDRRRRAGRRPRTGRAPAARTMRRMPSARAIPAANSGPLPPKATEREVARVAAALARDRPDRADHVGGGDQMGAVGRVLERQPERSAILARRPPRALARR